jgi:GNAT superfamily N-acetyltransferase
MSTEVTTHYLEMTAPGELRPKRVERADLTLARVDPPMPELNRFFYTAIGGDWYWVDRLPWSYEQWMEFLGRPGVETWALSVAGVPAGYAELDPQPGGDVEVAYFGILSRFVGQGLGGHLLTAAVERAWMAGARRVWVHTCSLDHPVALSHYQARGFRVYRTEVTLVDLPPEALGPWPGARGSGREKPPTAGHAPMDGQRGPL